MRVFVSYSRPDKARVQEMLDALDAAGHDIWSDRLVLIGAQWWSKILDEIERADVVVLALSPNYLRSNACALERDYATALGRPLLPVEIVRMHRPSLPGDLALIHMCESVQELVEELPKLPSTTPLPSSMPDRPSAPLSALAQIRDDLLRGPLDESVQLAMVAELILASRSDDTDERETALVAINESARSRFLFQRPARLLAADFRPDDASELQVLPPHKVPPDQKAQADREVRSEEAEPPRLVIVGAAIGSFGIMSFLFILRVYEVFPRPYDLVGPHFVMLLVGTAMCASALRRHRRSATLGLMICSLSLLAIIVDVLKTGGAF